jgi:hypothetical protein
MIFYFISLYPQKRLVMKSNISKGVVTELAEGFGKKSSFTVFMEVDDKLTYNPDKDTFRNKLQDFVYVDKRRLEILDRIQKRFVENKNQYGMITQGDEFQRMLTKLLDLETEMIQARCFLNIDIKLGITKRVIKSGEKVEYIIARAPFYRPGYVRSEITVYMGSTQELGSDLEKLKEDRLFISNADFELRSAMMKEMKY